MTRTSPWRLLATTALIILSGSMSQAQEIARAFDQLPAVVRDPSPALAAKPNGEWSEDVQAHRARSAAAGPPG